MSKFQHYEKYGAPVCLELTDRPVIDRLATRNQRTKYKADGICLGAYVTGRGMRPVGYYDNRRYDVTGQVWAQAAPFENGSNRGYWFVVDSKGAAYIMHESTMTLVGQAQDAPLEGVA